jgi:hypothetical protein
MCTGARSLTALRRRYIDNLSVPRIDHRSLRPHHDEPMCVLRYSFILSLSAYSIALDKLSDEELATIGHIWTERPGDIALTAEALMSLTKDTAQGLLESLQKVSGQCKVLDRGNAQQNTPVSGLLANAVAESLCRNISRRELGFQAPVDALAHAPRKTLRTTASDALREKHRMQGESRPSIPRRLRRYIPRDTGRAGCRAEAPPDVHAPAY